jgi:hypothetical protein
VFENRVLRRIFGIKRDEVTESGEVHNKELSNLYSSPNTVQVNKSRRIRGAGHVARVRERTSLNRLLIRRPGEKTT